MASHNFNFPGGDILTGMGASWFVSYAYHQRIDSTHMNWNRVSTAKSRISKYESGKSYYKAWLTEIIAMNPLNLNKNTIGLSSDETKRMAKELLATFKD